MIPKADIWFKLASRLMPPKHSVWLNAMKAELNAIENPSEKQAFAFGCFKTALLQGAQSRKGLNYIARGSGAVFIVIICLFGIFSAGSFGTEPEAISASKLITILCTIYICGAIFLVSSLRNLRAFAGLGFSMAASCFVYISVTQSSFANLPTDFLAAISIEAAGFMAALFLSTIYLRWLYSPNYYDA